LQGKQLLTARGGDRGVGGGELKWQELKLASTVGERSSGDGPATPEGRRRHYGWQKGKSRKQKEN